MTIRTVGLTQFKQHMTSLSREAYKKNQRLVVVENDQPVFEVRHIAKKVSALARTVAAVKEGAADAKAGRTISLAQARKRYSTK